MKETDIRERIHLFLRNTVRYVVVPASMGIGLALVGGCPSSPPGNPDGSADTSSLPTGSGGAGGTTSSAAGGAVAVYMAMMPDALYMAVMPDASAGGATGTGGATGAGGATGGMTSPVLKYMAIMPDAGVGTGTGGATGAGGMTAVPLYMAMAGMPATGGVTGAGGATSAGGMTAVPLYMALAGMTTTGGSTATGGTTVGATKYSAPEPVDAGSSAGGMVALYMAMMPDAGLTTRYASPQPKQDAGLGPMPLYMAPMPTKD